MSNRPDSFMPFYVGDYLRDTLALSRDQHGAYCLLLMAYWGNGGPLPIDEDAFAAITKATPAEWKKLRPIMLRYFSEDATHWHQKRADIELKEKTERYDARSKAGKNGNAKRWGVAKGDVCDSLGDVNASRKRIAKRLQTDRNPIAGGSQPQPQPQPHTSLNPSGSNEVVAQAAARERSAAPPAATEPGWEIGHERWVSFKEKLGDAKWALWFRACKLNGSELSLVAPSSFERDQIGQKFSTALEAHFGERVTIKILDGAAYAGE